MSETRNANMEKRRRRILRQARMLLAEGGFDTLNLRDLAAASDVTVPTIYNLIGNKNALLKALVADAFANFEKSLKAQLPCPTEEIPALMMSTLVQMVACDEGYYRASHLAGERLENKAQDRSDYDLKRPTLRVIAHKFCDQARAEGLLRGEVNSEALVELMINNQQAAMRDWAHQMLSLEEMQTQALRGFYVALAADAQDSFREKIIGWLKSLEQQWH